MRIQSFVLLFTLGALFASGVAFAGDRPWSVVHADLPLLEAADMGAVIAGAADGATVLAPSRDGGTNIIASTGRFDFRFGPASFARHLAGTRGSPVKVVARPGTLIEIDTPADLRMVAELPGGAWLAPFLA